MKIKLVLLSCVFIFTSRFAKGESLYSEEPASCVDHRVYPCFIATKFSPSHIQLKDLSLWIGSETSLELSSNKLKLLSGNLMYQSKEDFSFETGLITGLGNGSIWISQNSKILEARTVVINLSGDVIVRTKLGRVEGPIPSGFENWYALKSGSSGVPKPTQVAGTKSRFFALFGSLSKDFGKQFDLWSKEWGENTSIASQQYSELVRRSLASVQKRNEDIKRRRESEAHEQQVMRQMFREKNGLGPNGGEGSETGESPDPGPDSD